MSDSSPLAFRCSTASSQVGSPVAAITAVIRLATGAGREPAHHGEPITRALPDPEVSLGVERTMAGEVTVPDNMGGMPVMGRLEPMTQTSLMVSQGLPWPGKRAARGQEARALATAAEADLERVRMDLIQQVKGTWLEAQSLVARLALLARESQVISEAESLAQSHYAHGQGSQADRQQHPGRRCAAGANRKIRPWAGWRSGAGHGGLAS